MQKKLKIIKISKAEKTNDKEEKISGVEIEIMRVLLRISQE